MHVIFDFHIHITEMCEDERVVVETIVKRASFWLLWIGKLWQNWRSNLIRILIALLIVPRQFSNSYFWDLGRCWYLTKSMANFFRKKAMESMCDNSFTFATFHTSSFSFMNQPMGFYAQWSNRLKRKSTKKKTKYLCGWTLFKVHSIHRTNGEKTLIQWARTSWEKNIQKFMHIFLTKWIFEFSEHERNAWKKQMHILFSLKKG